MADQMFSPQIVDTMPGFTPGCVLFDDDGKGWTYVKASGALSALHTAIWIDDFEAVMATDAASVTKHHAWFGGVPVVPIPDNHFGWCQVFGMAHFRMASGAGPGAYPYTTDTAGVVGHTSSGHHRVRSVVGFVGSGSNESTIRGVLSFPGGNQLV